MTKQTTQLPESMRANLVKAGKARAAQITTADRKEWGKRAWQTRIAKALAAEQAGK